KPEAAASPSRKSTAPGASSCRAELKASSFRCSPLSSRNTVSFDSSAMSRSRLIAASAHVSSVRPGKGSASGHQLVAAALGNQHLRMRRLALDLLAQAVDVGFQRVGGDAGIVAPDL